MEKSWGPRHQVNEDKQHPTPENPSLTDNRWHWLRGMGNQNSPKHQLLRQSRHQKRSKRNIQPLSSMKFWLKLQESNAHPKWHIHHAIHTQRHNRPHPRCPARHRSSSSAQSVQYSIVPAEMVHTLKSHLNYRLFKTVFINSGVT